jgi:hypothetical protein
MSGERIGNSNQFLALSGLVSAPAYSWASDNDSGWYRIGANNVGLALNGAKVLDVATTGLTITGAVVATTVNGNTFTTGTGVLTIAAAKTATHNATTTFAGTDGKTLTISNSLTLAGTDATVMTFPTTSATIARTDAANTFTGTQTFGALVYTTLNGNTWATGTGTLSIAAAKTLTASNTLTLAGTDSTTMTFPATSANVAALNLTAQAFTGGIRVTSYSIGTPSNGSTTTLDSGNGPLQYMTNNVAGLTIAAPANDGNLVLYILNGASAGTVTWSGFTVGSNTGDALTTTNTSKFMVSITRINSISTYIIKALQ